MFLADTGSVPNLITEKTAIEKFPEQWRERQKIQIPVQGIGGQTALTSLLHLTWDEVSIPFCTGPHVPLNIIGLDWIQRVADLPHIYAQLNNPREAIYRWPTHGFSWIIQLSVNTWEIGNSLDPTINTAFPSESLITSLSPSQKNVKVGTYKTSSEWSSEQSLSLRHALAYLRQQVLDLPQKTPTEQDLHTDENTIIPESKWRQVYEPFAQHLGDLRGQLKGPPKLPYPCTVKLRDPKIPPYVTTPYNIRHPKQKAALEYNIQRFLDLGIIEKGQSDWRLSLFCCK